jgi:hypothetical protein
MLERVVSCIVFPSFHHKHSSDIAFTPNFVERRKAPKSADFGAPSMIRRISALASAHFGACAEEREKMRM